MRSFVTNKPLSILLIGASGVFGSRLAERASSEPGVRLTLAGRDLGKLKALRKRLGAECAVVSLDRDTITPDQFSGYDLVIDAAGPFQQSATTVIEGAITARVDYLDLADGREFVANIGRFDAAARDAGVSILTGASSVPALSHAVIDAVTVGWSAIDTIKVGIFPGNRAPRGRAVIEAILSYAGKPVRVFMDGAWQQQPAWGLTHRWAIEGVGTRWASVCDTPDQDLLVARYAPRRSAEFYAGLELGVMHLGLAALSLFVRWRLFRSLKPLARPLRHIADWLLPFGSDIGAMQVIVCGNNREGQRVEAKWTLRAFGNCGPYVPTLAALAVIRMRRDGQKHAPGARDCAGLLRLDKFRTDFDALGIGRSLEIQML
jgi:Saccharopine dehydrogenase NADP binding domain